jgi:23S rRNA pseudoU1915 N3-methylase RlmH
MKILLHLGWVKSGQAGAKSFKAPAAYELTSDYLWRLGAAMVPAGTPGKGTGSRVWLCDRIAGAKILSSEELSRELNAARVGGARELHVVIAGPDGFSEDERKDWTPDLRWSFGPLTLPHELAAVVAAEQLYRAQSILDGKLYHAGH